MQVWKLTRNTDAGFSQASYSCGVFASKELAETQALILEPNTEIRDYEYHITAIDVLVETYAITEAKGHPREYGVRVTDSRYDEDGDDDDD